MKAKLKVSESMQTGSVSASYFQYPYLTGTSYDENYRGQYHYSPPSGWMNDINGLWYYNGIYHITFQSNPHDLWLNGDDMHWGHATSKDLIHWTQQPIALEPGQNGVHSSWSGSTVVDVSNTSGLQTSSNPVLVTLYTGTSLGTCLAYSNDLGVTWQNYNGNPLKPGAEEPRDPHVFRYNNDHWVMALFENGTTFYTSADLKNWIYASNINFGWECPDIYQLSIDDNSHNQKWILQDASGEYLIGQFDGYTFTSQSKPIKMDVGPDFYAAQTFYRNTLEDDRVIQMAWLGRGNINGLNTVPWKNEATFPVELKLKTLPEGVRVIRNPVSEINSNYKTTKHWNAQTIISGQNIFNSISSRCYDLTTEFDLNDTTATKICFQLANKSIVYDIQNSNIFNLMVNLVDNHLKIRILVDWSQVEVFVNDGYPTYTEKFGFNSSQSCISMMSNGSVNLISSDFCEVDRIWENALTANFLSNLTGSWEPVSGTWIDTSIGKQGNSKSGDSFLLNSQTDSDSTYEGDLRAMIGPSSGLVFRANPDATSGYCVNVDTNYEMGGSHVKLWAPGRGELIHSDQTINGGETYHLKVLTTGNNIKVYFNNGLSPIINYTDLTPILDGQFGLMVCSSNYGGLYPGYGVFQNVNVRTDKGKSNEVE